MNMSIQARCDSLGISIKALALIAADMVQYNGARKDEALQLVMTASKEVLDRHVARIIRKEHQKPNRIALLKGYKWL